MRILSSTLPSSVRCQVRGLTGLLLTRLDLPETRDRPIQRTIFLISLLVLLWLQRSCASSKIQSYFASAWTVSSSYDSADPNHAAGSPIAQISAARTLLRRAYISLVLRTVTQLSMRINLLMHLGESSSDSPDLFELISEGSDRITFFTHTSKTALADCSFRRRCHH